MVYLWSGADLETEGSFGNRVEFILFYILPLNSMGNEFPQISPFI